MKRQIKVSNLVLGDGRIIIQSMTTTRPKDIDKTIDQILKLEEAGCEMVRVTVMDMDDAKAIKEIIKHIHIPLVADIHFDYKLAIASMENGISKVRINPGNIGSKENVLEVVKKAKEYHVPIRIGVNSGSIEKRYLEEYNSLIDAALASLDYHIKLLEECDFYDIVLSVKMSNVLDTVKVYEELNKRYDYPLHLGVTEAGTTFGGTIKSSMALAILLNEGIGDTIRVSLTGDPVNEIKVAKEILSNLNLYKKPKLIVCPTCGRTEVNIEPIAKRIENYLENINLDIKVAIMGCIVNGPGEAREADLGVAFIFKEGVVFKKGEVIFKGTPDEALDKLKEEIFKF